MADNKLEIVIALKDLASGQLKEISGGTEALSSALKSQQSSVQSLNMSWGTLLKGALGAAALYQIKDAASEVIKLGLNMDSLNRSMKAATGSAGASQESFAFLRKTSDDLGLSFQSVIRPYMQLASAARGTNLEGAKTREIFTAVAEASTVMGLSGSQVERVLYALQQMMAKGTVSMEELRQQLGDQLPGAFQIAARAMGVSTQEFSKMVEEGKVYSEDFLPKFAAQLRTEFAGSVQEASESGRAHLERFNNAMFEIKITLSEIVLPAFTSFLTTVTPMIKNFGEGMDMLFGKTELAEIQRRTHFIIGEITALEQKVANPSWLDKLVNLGLFGNFEGQLAAYQEELAALQRRRGELLTPPAPGGSTAPLYDPDAAKKAKAAKVAAKKEYEQFLKEVEKLQQEAWKSIGADESGEVGTNQAKALEKRLEGQEKQYEAFLKEVEKLQQEAWKSIGADESGVFYPNQAKALEKALEERKKEGSEYRQWNLAQLQAMVRDTATTEEQKRKIVAEINRRVEQNQVGMYDALKMGWNDVVGNMRGKFQSTAQYVLDYGRNMAQGLHTSISDTFFNAFTGKLDSIKDVWSNFTEGLKQSFFRMVSDIVAKKIIMMFTSAWDGEPSGKGTIEGLLGIDVPFLTFALGGSVPGSWNGRAGFGGDSVPAMLTPGEYVMRREVAQDPVIGQLIRAINEDRAGFGTVAAGKNIPGFSAGGIVAPWLPHYGFLSKVVSALTGGLTDILGITHGGYLPNVGSYISNVVRGESKFDIFEAIARGIEPSGFVRGGTRALGTIVPESIGQYAGMLGPAIGAIIGGPGGAAAGADIAAEFQVGQQYGMYATDAQVNERDHFLKAAVAAIAAYVAQSGSEYVQVGDTTYSVPSESIQHLGNGQVIVADAYGTYAGASVSQAQGAWNMVSQQIGAGLEGMSNVGSAVTEWMSDIPGSTMKLLGTAWDKLASLPETLLDYVTHFDVAEYASNRLGDILGNFKLMLSGMTGGELLDKTAIAGALGIGSEGYASARAGADYIPYDNFPVIAHKGERILSADDNRDFGRMVKLLQGLLKEGRRGGGDLHVSIVLDRRTIARAVIQEFRSLPEFSKIVREVG